MPKKRYQYMVGYFGRITRIGRRRMLYFWKTLAITMVVLYGKIIFMDGRVDYQNQNRLIPDIKNVTERRQYEVQELKYHPPLQPGVEGEAFKDVDTDLLHALHPSPVHLNNATLGHFVFLTAGWKEVFPRMTVLVSTLQYYFPNHTILLYDLGLLHDHVLWIRLGWCNVIYHKLNFSKYPDYVENLDYHVFKPLVINEALKTYPAVFWVDTAVRMTGNYMKPLYKLATRNGGLVPFLDPECSLAVSPKLSYLPSLHAGTLQCLTMNYLLIYRTEKVIRDILQWWVTCALSHKCIMTHICPNCSPVQSALTVLFYNTYKNISASTQLVVNNQFYMAYLGPEGRTENIKLCHIS